MATKKAPKPRVRGCGLRIQKALYLSVGTSPEAPGVAPPDIAKYLVDPPIPFTKEGNLRAPMLVEDRHGVKHVVLGVGAENYPTVADFVEEAVTMGISKRVPLGWDFTGLTPGKSKLLLTHPRAIPNFKFDANYACVTKGLKGVEKSKVHQDRDPQCLGALWPLSGYHLNKKHEANIGQEAGEVIVQTPSVTYPVPQPKAPLSPGADPLAFPGELLKPESWTRGIFLALDTYYLEFVNKDKTVPKKVAEKAQKTGIILTVAVE